MNFKETLNFKKNFKELPRSQLKLGKVETQQQLQKLEGRQQHTCPWPSQPPHPPGHQRFQNPPLNMRMAMEHGQLWSGGQEDRRGIPSQVKQTPPLFLCPPPSRGQSQGYGSLSTNICFYVFF
eukprot:EG_transcript_34940